jgi:hypothetical protein
LLVKRGEVVVSKKWYVLASIIEHSCLKVGAGVSMGCSLEVS